MNERIKELLKQSCGFEYDEDGHELTPILVGKDLEKFAELIVRDCIDTYDHWANHSMDKNAFVVAKTHVKEHFGFKE